MPRFPEEVLAGLLSEIEVDRASFRGAQAMDQEQFSSIQASLRGIEQALDCELCRWFKWALTQHIKGNLNIAQFQDIIQVHSDDIQRFYNLEMRRLQLLCLKQLLRTFNNEIRYPTDQVFKTKQALLEQTFDRFFTPSPDTDTPDTPIRETRTPADEGEGGLNQSFNASN